MQILSAESGGKTVGETKKSVRIVRKASMHCRLRQCRNRMCKTFLAFGCRITGVDLYPREDENYGKMVGIENLSDVLSKSDIVILTLPLTKETRHLMNEEKFSQMKDGAILVNIARGAVVDTEALMREMPRLGGAVLDVFEEEPLREDSPLWEMENVIVTPHNSFVGDGNARRLAGVIYENIRRELSDKYTSFKSNV